MPTTITGLSSVTTTAPSISAVNLTAGSDTTDDSDSVTASITPSANKLILLTITSRADAVQPTISSVSGNGLTWVEINHRDYDAAGSRRTVFLYRAMGSSPTTGSVTITWGGIQTAKAWCIDEITGADTSGTNGSGAIVQSVTNEGASVTSLTITLADFSSSSNATYGAFSGAGDDTFTAGSGFSITAQTHPGTNEISVASEFKATNDTSVDITLSPLDDIGGVAIEIKNAFPSAMVWVV